MVAARGDVPTSPVPSLSTRSWPPLRSAFRLRSFTGALLTLSVVLVVIMNVGTHSSPSTTGLQRLSLPDSSLWQSLVAMQLQTARGPLDTTDTDVRIMFMGDSITDGGAANTTHPRKHPNGSCSYRFSFLAQVLTNRPQEGQHKLLRDRTRTVGPFSTNCGSDVIPLKCFETLSSAPWWWGPTEAAAVVERGRARMVHHAATSGVTALGLLHHRETWPKRAACFEKSGLLAAPPSLPPDVLAAEDAYRAAFPQQRNVSDVAVWAAAYRPHLLVLLLGTNDLRWGRPWREVLFHSLPSIVFEVLTFAEQHRAGPGVPTAPPPFGPPPPYNVVQQVQCSSFVAVSTLYPRSEYVAEIAEINRALLSMRERRRRGGIACPLTSWHVGELLWLCHPCVRIVDGGAPIASNGQRMGNDAFVSTYTFDGLHPNDAGDVLLGRRLAEEVMAS